MSEQNVEKKKFNKERFDIISEDKQQQVLQAAIDEFSENGFNGTSINKVAKRANISIGAMYSYFESKEDLFLTIVERMFCVLENAIKEVDLNRDFYEVIEGLFVVAHDYAISNPQLNQIYLDFSTHSLSNLSSRVSRRLETISKDMYLSIIEKAQEKHRVDQTIDPSMLSFFIDNLIMMYHFSFTSDYFKERMQIFLGNHLVDAPELQIDEIMKIIKKLV